MQTEYHIQGEVVTLHRRIHGSWWLDRPEGDYWVERMETRKGKELFILKNKLHGDPKNYAIGNFHKTIEAALSAYLEHIVNLP